MDGHADPAIPVDYPLAQLAVASGDAEALVLLLDYGIPVDRADANGVTALALATRDQRVDLVELLLNKDADPDPAGPDGATPLMLAVRSGSTDLTTMLLGAGADLDRKDHRGQTAVHHSASSCDAGVIELLVPGSSFCPDATGQWPLHRASSLNCSALIDVLLDQGHDMDVESQAGNTPLSIAAAAGSADVVRSLLAHGANANRRDQQGETALHRAVRNGRVEAAALLLQRGANPSIRNDNALNAFDLSTDPAIDALLADDESMPMLAIERD